VTRKAGAQKVGAVQVETEERQPEEKSVHINVLADDKTFGEEESVVNEPISSTLAGAAALEWSSAKTLNGELIFLRVGVLQFNLHRSDLLCTRLARHG